LNGQDYQLSPNDGENVVHSGPEGFHHRVFEGPIVDKEGDKHVITYNLRVNHLEDNFPGTINVFVKYTVEEEIKVGGFTAGKVSIEYDVRLLGDAEETAIAMTNHRYPRYHDRINESYFNISGGKTIEGTRVQLHTAMKQDVDDAKIPTGTISPHPDIRLFTSSLPLSITLGASTPAFDHCFLMPDMTEPVIDTRTFPVRDIAQLFHEESRINLLASSTEPTFQLYTGDGVDVKSKDGNVLFGARAGLCLEAGKQINAINDEHARKWVVLKKGEIYGSHTSYSAWLSP
jgi:aldose 1-epimerase